MPSFQTTPQGYEISHPLHISTEAVRRCITEASNKIDAIKRLRDTYGTGLREAKEIVEHQVDHCVANRIFLAQWCTPRYVKFLISERMLRQLDAMSLIRLMYFVHVTPVKATTLSETLNSIFQGNSGVVQDIALKDIERTLRKYRELEDQ